LERARKARERLHRRSNADRLSGAHASLDPAGASGLAGDLPVGADDLVVGFRAWPCGGGETVADLHTLDGLDAHQGLREPAVELAIGLHVRSESRRRAERKHLEHAAERVATLPRAVDLLDHAGGGLL